MRPLVPALVAGALLLPAPGRGRLRTGVYTARVVVPRAGVWRRIAPAA